MKILSAKKINGKLVVVVFGKESQDDSEIQLGRLFDLLNR